MRTSYRKRRTKKHDKAQAIKKHWAIQQALRIEIALAVAKNPKEFGTMGEDERNYMALRLANRLYSEERDTYENFIKHIDY